MRGKDVQGSPFSVNSFAPDRVVIDPIPGGAKGKPVQFYGWSTINFVSQSSTIMTKISQSVIQSSRSDK